MMAMLRICKGLRPEPASPVPDVRGAVYGEALESTSGEITERAVEGGQGRCRAVFAPGALHRLAPPFTALHRPLLTRLISLHLHGDVPDPHVAQALLDRLEDALVVARVSDDQVPTHGDHPACHGPDVQVVDRCDPGDRGDAVVDLVERDAGRRRLQQDVRALLHEPPGAGEDE